MPDSDLNLKAILAMAANRVIGHQGGLPWHYPEDLQFFKRTTMGHPIIMGRSTYESIGRPLPGRQNVVISRTMEPTEGLTVLRSLEELDSSVLEQPSAFIIGGAGLLKTALPLCREFYLTYIDETPEGDVFLPPFEDQFELAEVLESAPPLEFRRYERRNSPE